MILLMDDLFKRTLFELRLVNVALIFKAVFNFSCVCEWSLHKKTANDNELNKEQGLTDMQ